MPRDRFSSSGMVIILSVTCVLLALISSVLAVAGWQERQEKEEWKRRWITDTHDLADDLEAIAARLAKESAEKTKAQAELDELKHKP